MPVSDPATASALDVAFHPRSLAVAGVSPGKRGWGGGMMFYQAAILLEGWLLSNYTKGGDQ